MFCFTLQLYILCLLSTFLPLATPLSSPSCCVKYPTMPYQWNAERERQMLLLAISRANLRPSADTWSAVAALLGGGLTPSAVR